MGRALFILLTVWALVAAPTLCSGGVLAHHCDEPAEADHESHESDCSVDPCNQDPIRQNDDDAALTAHKPLPVVAPLVQDANNGVWVACRTTWESAGSSSRLNLQYHLSDRPLLN